MKTTNLLRALLALALISGLATVALSQATESEVVIPKIPVTAELCSSPTCFDYSEWKFRVGFKAPCCALCFTISKEAVKSTVCHTVYDKLFKRRNACYSPESKNAAP